MIHKSLTTKLQPVPEKMTLKMFVEMQIEILDGQISGLFLNKQLKRDL